jgi:DNA-directed RNA polymerase subunit RPC12/RpoP
MKGYLCLHCGNRLKMEIPPSVCPKCHLRNVFHEVDIPEDKKPEPQPQPIIEQPISTKRKYRRRKPRLQKRLMKSTLSLLWNK